MLEVAQATALHLPIADNSVDLIFTDPPYPKEYLVCYEWLASEANRVLKPGGFCLAMSGGLYLPEVMASMSRHLNYYWMLEVFFSDVASVIWPRRVIARSKPILAYSKGPSVTRCNVLSGLIGGGNDKKYHHWGQDVESARYFIDCFSRPGDLVLDPFVGGGTTLVACGLIGRKSIGFDIDLETLYTARSRLNEADIPMLLPLFMELNNAKL